MKKLVAFGLLMAVLLGNSGAGCSSKNQDDPQPDHMQSLIGKWEAISFNYQFTEQNGTVKNTGTELKSKGTVIIWEFFSDGRLKATGNTNPTGAATTREVRWTLNARLVEKQGDIDEGTLTIIGDEERTLAKTLGQAGDLTYEISTIVSQQNGKTRMYLSVDATKVGPYKKNVLTYIYEKL